MRRRFAIAALSLMVALAPLTGGEPVSAHPTNPHKSLLMDRWYQTIAGGGIPFMTLSTFTSYGCGAECTSDWTIVRNDSVADWNTSATTVYFATTVSMTESNDVRITVKTTNCTTHFGSELCMSAEALGAVFDLDTAHTVSTTGDLVLTERSRIPSGMLSFLSTRPSTRHSGSGRPPLPTSLDTSSRSPTRASLTDSAVVARP